MLLTLQKQYLYKEIGDEYEDDEEGVNAIDITETVPV